MTTQTGIDELTLLVTVKLTPSNSFFSKVKADLLLNRQPVHSVVIRIPQGALATNEFEYTSVLDMKGIKGGTYRFQTTIYDQYWRGKKFCAAVKEISVHYVPQTRERPRQNPIREKRRWGRFGGDVRNRKQVAKPKRK
jgi:hypothetical protein